ncbi:MAG: hypothetical protein MI743_04750 [Sneathiellales bacterium]|nr:hypothetical protein [Sneathiellales bacterium]
MKDQKKKHVKQTYKLAASPEKIWKALNIPEFRRRWWPDGEGAEKEETETSELSVRYRMKEKEPPFLESVVTFKIVPEDGQTTTLEIIHQLEDSIVIQLDDRVANDNSGPLMLAA